MCIHGNILDYNIPALLDILYQNIKVQQLARQRMIDFEVYTMDQKFRKGLHRFIDWWSLLAEKKADRRTMNKVQDIGGHILCYWENLRDDKKKLVYSQRFPYKTLLDMSRYSDYRVFTKKDDNDCFLEALSKLKK